MYTCKQFNLQNSNHHNVLFASLFSVRTSSSSCVMTSPKVWTPQVERQEGSSFYRPDPVMNGSMSSTPSQSSPHNFGTAVQPTTSPTSPPDRRYNSSAGQDVSISEEEERSIWECLDEDASINYSSTLQDVNPLPDQKSDPDLRKTSTEQSLTICGVQVKFPFKPYPSQIALMEKVALFSDGSCKCNFRVMRLFCHSFSSFVCRW